MSLDGSAEAPQSRNSAEADNEFVASARLIAGDNPPSWLIAHLARWAPSLRIDHHVHKRQPSRSAVVAELKATLGAIRTLKAATKNRALLEFLDLQEGASIFNASVLADELDDFEQRALFALSSSSLSGASGKTKAGAGKALHPNSSSPKSLCAAVILEAWVYFHKGKHPAASNTAIAAAANAYWEGSVGIPTGWGDSRLGSWRPYFKEASKAESAAIRNELRRHILTSAGPLS